MNSRHTVNVLVLAFTHIQSHQCLGSSMEMGNRDNEVVMGEEMKKKRR